MFKTLMLVPVMLMLMSGLLNTCGAAEKKLVMDNWYDVEVGDLYTVNLDVRIANSPDAVKALGKAIDKKDWKGEKKLFDDKKVEKLPTGSTVQVLAVVRLTRGVQRLMKSPFEGSYAKCSFTRKDKTTGEGYILLSAFDVLGVAPVK